MNGILKKITGHCFHGIRLPESIYRFEGHKIQYLFEPAQSDVLIVSFSAFPGKFRSARYNYIRTLAGASVNKLFILDNFGYLKRGSYYLGENGDFFVERAVIRLIDHIASEHSIRKRIFLGSSKGGWAALYFGMKYDCSSIVAGAPQYYLGRYLSSKQHRNYLRHIMGSASPESAETLDSLLRDAIASLSSPRKIYLHYSTSEHTYTEHIRFLLEELEKNPNCTLFTDVCRYSEHGEVSKFFPTYIKKVVARETE